MLRAEYIIRRLITKGDTLVFKDGGFHGGDILPGGKINRLLTGDNGCSAIWTPEKDYSRSSGTKRSAMPGRLQELPASSRPTASPCGHLQPIAPITQDDITQGHL